MPKEEGRTLDHSFSILDLIEKSDKPQTVPVLSKMIPVTSYTFWERKGEGGKKISSKEMGEMGRDFLPPFPFYMTSQELSCSKLGQIGVRQSLLKVKNIG